MDKVLSIFNPSPYIRSDSIVLSIAQKEINLPHNCRQLSLIKSGNVEIPCQVDHIAYPEFEYDLSFCADDVISGDMDYLHASEEYILKGPAPEVFSKSPLSIRFFQYENQQRTSSIEYEKKITDYVEISNGLLTVRINITPNLDGDFANWYSGGLTSIRLYNKKLEKEIELLHLCNLDYLTHDPEKRYMQVDFIEVPWPQPKPYCSISYPMFDKPYEVVSYGIGPIRAFILLKSASLLLPAYKSTPELHANLYRKFVLFPNKPFLFEQLHLIGESRSQEALKRLNFRNNYFSHINLFEIQVKQIFGITDWCLIYENSLPRPAFGFATDAHLAWMPRTDHDKRIWYSLKETSSINCLHYFMTNPIYGDEDNIDLLLHTIGHQWYETIFKPLRANLKR